MTRHKKPVPDTSHSTIHIKSLHPLMPQKGIAQVAEIRPRAPHASGRTFIEDFTGEHSSPGMRSTSIGIPGCF